MRALTICSGGLDSTTLVYYLRSLGDEQTLISFGYGQRHRKELQFAAKTARKLSLEHIIIDISAIGKYLTGSALTDNVEVPDGHYAADNMAITVVPNRNAIMLSFAWGIACSRKVDILAAGVHRGDRAQYPDCRTEFIDALNTSLRLGTEGCRNEFLSLHTPFINMTKTEIVGMGRNLDVPFEDCWSCYKGGEIACGTCGTDCERLEAMSANGIEDPLQYMDRKSWKKYVAEFKKAKA